MSYNTLKALVNSKIYENTEQRITGGDMNDVLQSAIASLGAHYQMGGLVSPTDHITVGDEPVVFIATTPGTYTYFGSQVVADGEVALLVWSGTAWSKQTPDIATRTEVSQLGQEIGTTPIKKYAGQIQSTTWVIDDTRKHYVIPVSGSDVVEIQAPSNVAYCAFLKSYATPVSGETPDFCDGYEGRQYIDLTTQPKFTLPTDCRYLILNVGTQTYVPTKLTINGIDFLNGAYSAIAYIGEYLINLGYQYVGIATPSTNPGTLNKNVFYLALTAGTYTYFEGIVVNDGEISILKYNGEWNKDSIPYNEHLFTNLYNDADIITGKYITLAGVIADAQSYYRLVKFKVNETTKVFLSTSGTDNGILAKYTDDTYETFSKMLVSNKRNFEELITLDAGYYALSYGLSISNKKTILSADIVPLLSYIESQIVPTGEQFFIKTEPGKNLFNKSTAIAGYLNNAGEEIASGNYFISDYISVIAGENYYLSADEDTEVSTSPNTYCVFYDDNKNVISTIEAYYKNIVIPSGAAFIRFTYHKDVTLVMFNKGTTRGLYEEYSPLGGYPILISQLSSTGIEKLPMAVSSLGNNSRIVSTDSLAGGSSLTINDFPKTLKKGYSVSVYVEFEDGNFGNGFAVNFANLNGLVNYSISVTAGNISVSVPYAPTETVAHGLSFSKFVKLACSVNNGELSVVLITFAGIYRHTFQNWGYDANGTPSLISGSAAVFSNVKFTIGHPDIKKAVWAFGDSYFTFADDSRIMYYLNEWGYTNMLISGFGGMTPAGGITDLKLLLNYGCPKYIVWCLGMNGNYAGWKAAYDELVEICSEYGIELILATIPVVHNTDYTGKQQMTDDVRASGYRVLDVYAAVGCDSNGDWYGNGTIYDYQAGDGVHPTPYGGKAIAAQWLVDFPEIMQ